MADDGYITAAAWAKGIGYSIVASIVGGASKLAIRKSWLMGKDEEDEPDEPSHSDTVYYDHEEHLDCDAIGESFDNNSGQNDETDSSLLQSTTNNDQSISTANHCNTHNANDVNSQMRKNVIARCLRYSGMFGMTFVNPAFCVLAMNYASPSILAPFSGLTLVWIILFSEYLISERPQRKQIIAACLIILGQVVVGIFGDHTNDDEITLDEIEESYGQVSFQLFFVGMAIWLSVMMYLIIKPPSSIWRRFAWGVSSGSITGFQNFLKDSLSVVKACKANGEALPWYFFVLVCLAALTAFSGLLILTRCMKLYDATFSAAMFVGSFIISASIMADIHYHTFSNLVGIANYIMYPTGLLILMLGLYLLVQDTEGLERGMRRNQSGTIDNTESNHMDVPLMS